ncbi:hypothetical protein CDV31_015674, partial [Fusarium ambrosium]
MATALQLSPGTQRKPNVTCWRMHSMQATSAGIPCASSPATYMSSPKPPTKPERAVDHFFRFQKSVLADAATDCC